ncbi:hypothetical protein PHYPSEUDO_003944 [Phytophthora pseudosyringae]|uniref:Spp2/MOS2 G-patch domain-containing protein n=1 Tax=Phytophthora pseudosyringae TaxID=221518 RepID=A0A8T1VTD4_9STRA|nr:hypothetical protein PHYPSEUDO_003944 [Phytophthora pseudosyringae]
MKLGGFALKKGRKKALGAAAGFSSSAAAAPQEPEKVFVTDFDPDAPAPFTEAGHKPLVIPLLQTNAWHGAPEDAPADLHEGQRDQVGASEASADERAAAQILAETQAANKPPDREAKRGTALVIPIAGERERKRAELFRDGEKRSKSQKKPILQQNAVPGLDGLQDVTDKYRHDVAQRPEAPDVHAPVYASVPVEAFGAALLRGMGWKGDVDPDDVGAAPQPRHKLLGLGATKRPKLPGEDKKKRRKKRKDEDKDKAEDKGEERRSGLNADKPREERGAEDKERRRSRRASRSTDRDRRHRSRSQRRSDRRKRSRSRSQDRERGRRDRGRDQDRDRDRSRDRDRDRDSRSRSRSDRHSRRR